jgi:hypothetical protein
MPHAVTLRRNCPPCERLKFPPKAKWAGRLADIDLLRKRSAQAKCSPDHRTDGTSITVGAMSHCLPREPGTSKLLQYTISGLSYFVRRGLPRFRLRGNSRELHSGFDI